MVLMLLLVTGGEDAPAGIPHGSDSPLRAGPHVSADDARASVSAIPPSTAEEISTA
ncbi:hypothetical protein GCM10022202_31080 [Microbacterium marinilacus]|uniref:Uncharacterized protein n=1 Tax=Microbacterium marinilacus TaxID=415209 RepID=A0ABP7BSD9_9MICO